MLSHAVVWPVDGWSCPIHSERWISWARSVGGHVDAAALGGRRLTALFVVFCALALSRAGRDGSIGGVARIALVLVGAVVAWFFLEGTTRQERPPSGARLKRAPACWRRARPCRGRRSPASTPWPARRSKRSCERTLFATPEAMASAVSYVAAQLNLFADVSEFVNRGNSDMEPLLASLRRAVETDRYGLVAHVLATRDGCTTEQCPALALMRDARAASTPISRSAPTTSTSRGIPRSGRRRRPGRPPAQRRSRARRVPLPRTSVRRARRRAAAAAGHVGLRITGRSGARP